MQNISLNNKQHGNVNVNADALDTYRSSPHSPSVKLTSEQLHYIEIKKTPFYKTTAFKQGMVGCFVGMGIAATALYCALAPVTTVALIIIGLYVLSSVGCVIAAFSFISLLIIYIHRWHNIAKVSMETKLPLNSMQQFKQHGNVNVNADALDTYRSSPHSPSVKLTSEQLHYIEIKKTPFYKTTAFKQGMVGCFVGMGIAATALYCALAPVTTVALIIIGLYVLSSVGCVIAAFSFISLLIIYIHRWHNIAKVSMETKLPLNSMQQLKRTATIPSDGQFYCVFAYQGHEGVFYAKQSEVSRNVGFSNINIFKQITQHYTNGYPIVTVPTTENVITSLTWRPAEPHNIVLREKEDTIENHYQQAKKAYYDHSGELDIKAWHRDNGFIMLNLVIQKYQHPTVHDPVMATGNHLIVNIKSDDYYGVSPANIAKSRNVLARFYMLLRGIEQTRHNNSQPITYQYILQHYPGLINAILKQPFGQLDIDLAQGEPYWPQYETN